MQEDLKKLANRCTAAGLKCQIREQEQKEDPDLPPEEQTTTPPQIEIQIAEGRDFTPITITTGTQAETALQSAFEEFKRLKDFTAIWSQKKRVIECELAPGQQPAFFVRRKLEKIQGKRLGSSPGASPLQLPFLAAGETIKASISIASPELTILNSDGIGPRFNTLTIRIENIDISQHDQASKALEQIANSALFSLDLHYDMPLHLRRRHERTLRTLRTRRTAPTIQTLPSRQFENDAMSLYWYGRTSGSLPLLSFLAFYQVLEFYFPRYSRGEAAKRIKALLKDPTFSPDNDNDISRLLARIRSTAHSKSFGDEQSQLTSTLSECINPDELRTFISDSESRLTYYSGKDKLWKKTVDAPVRIDSEDIISDVSRRIYRLRCRIVHTKHEDGEIELLLPFSREARTLSHDISLAQYLATHVLIASSTSFTLPSSAEHPLKK